MPLRGKVIGLDTAPLIYFIEEHPRYLKTVKPFFQALSRGEFRVVTSIITLLEVLIHPLRRGNTELACQYRDILFDVEGLTTCVLSEDIAEEAAYLRAQHNLRVPDAIQLATATHLGASAFLTNDMRLPSSSTLDLLILDHLQ
jgi:predicted nucleic acid-binding protein